MFVYTYIHTRVCEYLCIVTESVFSLSLSFTLCMHRCAHEYLVGTDEL